MVIYAWRFKSEERSKSTPNWTKRRLHQSWRVIKTKLRQHRGWIHRSTNRTDLTWYEWEESAEIVSGKVPLAMPVIGEDGEAKKYPSIAVREF